MAPWKTAPDTTYCFATKSVVAWLPILESSEAAEIVVDSLKYAVTHKMVRLHAYVIMPTHAHFIFSAANGKVISNMMRDFGTHSSRALTEHLLHAGKTDFLRCFEDAALEARRGNSFKVWQDGFHPITLFNSTFYEQKRDYIHSNPVRKGLVEKPEYWKYSSARNYILGDQSIITVDCI